MAKAMVLLSRDTYNSLMSKQEDNAGRRMAEPVVTSATPATSVTSPTPVAASQEKNRELQMTSPRTANDPTERTRSDLSDENKHTNDFLFRDLETILKNIKSNRTMGKVMSLFLFLKQKVDSGNLTVTDKLEIVLPNGNVIKDSNIAELTRYAIVGLDSVSKRRKPTGYKEFRKLLVYLRAPKHLVRKYVNPSERKPVKGRYIKLKSGLVPGTSKL